MNRRLDPEAQAHLKHIWRQLHSLQYCKPVARGWNSKDEWFVDVGYCLDKYSLIDSKKDFDGRY